MDSPESLRDRTFRNPDGVAMKLQNFKRFDPFYLDQGLSGLSRGSGGETASLGQVCR